MGTVRMPAVAGSFYPEKPEVLRREVRSYLEESQREGSASSKKRLSAHSKTAAWPWGGDARPSTVERPRGHGSPEGFPSRESEAGHRSWYRLAGAVPAVRGWANRHRARGVFKWAPIIKAIIVPHAGYIYSGPIAASAYAHLVQDRESIRRIVLLGPAHFVGFQGLALSSADSFSTPLGTIPVDLEGTKVALDLPFISTLDEAHAEEHSLEVQLPFLQEILKKFILLPLAVGNASPEMVGKVLEKLWGGLETRIVISSDLSHTLPYETAQRVDEETAQTIEALNPKISPERACGFAPINGLLWTAQRKALRVTRADLRNSGDTAGSRDEVVGYGAFLFEEPGTGGVTVGARLDLEAYL